MQIRRSSRSLVLALPLVGIAAFVALGATQSPEAPGDPLIAGFKSTYPASVSDAVELVTGKNGTMRSNHTRPRRASRWSGRAISRHTTRPPGRTTRRISAKPRP